MDLTLDDRRTRAPTLAELNISPILLRERPFSLDLERRLQQSGLSKVLARLYAARGVDPEHAQYPVANLAHYRSMKGVMDAAEHLADAVMGGQPICVSGDYDVDGCCATSILCDGLRQLGLDPGGRGLHADRCSYVIPDRMTEGYGLTPQLVERVPAGTRLLITVDNGIAAHAGVQAAKDRGMRVIVTDHHLAGQGALPNADAIVNPNQPGCDFPAKDTCGAGVAWYLLVATRAALKARGAAEIAARLDIGNLLDLVAFATIADVVPLGYNNRILVNAGLRRIRAGKTRAGIRALAAVAGVNLEFITAQDFGFLLGPRINAAGRLEDMRTGVRLLLTDDVTEAEQLALELHQTNQRRRNIEANMRAEAEEMLRDLQDADNPCSVQPPAGAQPHCGVKSPESVPNVLCLYGSSWHEGVVGIVAGRLKEKWHRPALAFAPGGCTLQRGCNQQVDSKDGEVLKGSARSVSGLHIRDVLAEVDALQPGLILRFGGHAMAAGLTIQPKDFERFKAALEQVVDRKITPEMLDASILTDGEIPADECTLNTALDLDRLGVWGNAFPEPLFSGAFVVLESSAMSGGHWRMKLRMDGESGGKPGEEPIVGVRFFRGEEKDDPPLPPAPGGRISGSYTLKVNRWRGKETLQVIFQDIL